MPREPQCEWLVAVSSCWWLRGQNECGYSSVSCLGLLVPVPQSEWERELLVGILVLSESGPRGVPVGFQHLPCLCRAVGLVGSHHGKLESRDMGHPSCHWFYLLTPQTELVGVELGDLGFAMGLCQVLPPWHHPPGGVSCLLELGSLPGGPEARGILLSR